MSTFFSVTRHTRILVKLLFSNHDTVCLNGKYKMFFRGAARRRQRRVNLAVAAVAFHFATRRHASSVLSPATVPHLAPRASSSHVPASLERKPSPLSSPRAPAASRSSTRVANRRLILLARTYPDGRQPWCSSRSNRTFSRSGTWRASAISSRRSRPSS